MSRYAPCETAYMAASSSKSDHLRIKRRILRCVISSRPNRPGILYQTFDFAYSSGLRDMQSWDCTDFKRHGCAIAPGSDTNNLKLQTVRGLPGGRSPQGYMILRNANRSSIRRMLMAFVCCQTDISTCPADRRWSGC